MTDNKLTLEEDVTLSDGTVVRINGLLAVQYRKDPDKVRDFVEVHLRYLQARGTDSEASPAAPRERDTPGPVR